MHTKGPWEIIKEDRGYILKQEGKRGKYLYLLQEQPGLGLEATNNLNLIAAAPELLEACKRAYAYIVAYPSAISEETTRKIRGIITQAIAHARKG